MKSTAFSPKALRLVIISSGGEVTVVARIKPPEPTLQRGAPEGQLASIDLAAYQDDVGYELEQGAYGLMASENPQPDVVPSPSRH